ncbi:hypothetical protein ACT3UQ_15275 [Glutamicibacter sp. AOP12-B1-11]|uniref:hypothetical protein n=1 Tax=Micrococcaceae TaxID=1268 RepID=UPI0011B041FB|nr:hypothetical protein [Arthrobacter sp. MYb224]
MSRGLLGCPEHGKDQDGHSQSADSKIGKPDGIQPGGQYCTAAPSGGGDVERGAVDSEGQPGRDSIGTGSDPGVQRREGGKYVAPTGLALTNPATSNESPVPVSVIM